MIDLTLLAGWPLFLLPLRGFKRIIDSEVKKGRVGCEWRRRKGGRGGEAKSGTRQRERDDGESFLSVFLFVTAAAVFRVFMAIFSISSVWIAIFSIHTPIEGQNRTLHCYYQYK